MDHCQNGCPCQNFDCDLALNITDPVHGLESMGVMVHIGEFFCERLFNLFLTLKLNIILTIYKGQYTMANVSILQIIFLEILSTLTKVRTTNFTIVPMFKTVPTFACETIHDVKSPVNTKLKATKSTPPLRKPQ